MKIQSAFLSDVGRVRRQNEDSVAVLDDERLYLVADGMGGHAGGKRASETAVETIVGHVRGSGRTRPPGSTEPVRTDRAQLIEGIHRANRRILELAGMDSSLHGMGTTVAALVIDGDDRGAIVHVGDSRVYRL